ncbi:putative N-formylglutamate amidohydrolase [Roseobacter sp. MED193]|uniref:N-formylglutamate amidohydrolase n=1 Tax=Roseobacter sp. MED193 TaxID=314262 RepID=UPI0000689FF3|nr:N-formylglutamate amidohydrolase [Roseobacter sp. MED193]EAQ43980.1 putative N-formylglutamate amidohydrolase [Roseobacter sp. MED193]
MSVFDQHPWDIGFQEGSVPRRPLLGAKEPTPAKVLNGSGKGPFVFGCEHAGNRIPKSLGTLGLTKAERSRHIAWDIGAAHLTEKLSEKLDSPAVLQRYSRLVFDCNRTASHPGAFVVEADGSNVSGNENLGKEEKLEREEAIYRPFHNTLSEITDRRRWMGERIAYVAVHSFNDQVHGETRPWHVGFLYNQRSGMSRFMIDWFQSNTEYEVGDNQPYSPLDAVDHTLRNQAETRGLPYTMVEIRNDLLRSERQIAVWAALLTQALRAFAKDHNL